MSAPSEPEKYSVDEMMERLKTRQSAENEIEQGELVTRNDGSQAIRVRKRKRRSQQPHKEGRQQSRRVRMIQVAAGLILLLLVLAGAGGAIIYANSASFREKILSQITLSSGASVELQQFRMNPTSANANQLALTWPDGNALQRLMLRGVRAEVSASSFLGKGLTGEEVTAMEGTLNLHLPQPGEALRQVPAGSDPRPLRFKRYAIARAHVLMGDAANPFMRMQDSEISLSPPGVHNRAQLLLRRGDITLRGWPKLRMDRSHIEFRGQEMDIVAIRLRHDTENQGIIELSGTVSPYSAGLPSSLALRLEAYPLSGIVGPDLGRLIAGKIESLAATRANSLGFTPGPDPDLTLAVTFANAPMTSMNLSGFPFLFGLAQTTDDTWFERPVFESNVRGHLLRADGKVVLSDLYLESKGRMALRGTLAMAASRALSGNLDVGLSEAMIKSSRTRLLDSLFGAPSDGFRWLKLDIGGTAAAPTDTFRELFEAAALTRQPPSTPAIPTFEELTQPK